MRIRVRYAFFAVLAIASVAASGRSGAEIEIPDGPHVEIRGALAMGAVARAVAEGYMNAHPDAIVTVSGGGTYRGLKSVIVGTADIAMGTDGISDDLAALAATKNVTLESHAVFSDAVVVVVSPNNPITNLSLAQLRDIFSGKITRWEDLAPVATAHKHAVADAGARGNAHGGNARGSTTRGSKPPSTVDAGPPDDIDVVTFEGNAGPYETFKKEVLGDAYVITPRARSVGFGDFERSFGDKTIGYVGLHQLGHLKPVSVDGVLASAESVRARQYPIARQLSIVVRKPSSPAVRALVDDFLAPDKGQRIAESLGNVPVR